MFSPTTVRELLLMPVRIYFLHFISIVFEKVNIIHWPLRTKGSDKSGLTRIPDIISFPN